MADPAASGRDHENALARRARDGDRQAANDLLELLYSQLRALASRICDNAADSDDATQEALLAIVSGIGTFEGNSSVRTWAYRVATNACLDFLRKRNRAPVPTDADHLAARFPPGPAESALTDTRIDIDRALRTLPRDLRTVLVLRESLDLDYETIAEILGTPIGTVRSRLSRGRAQLARSLNLGNQMPPAGVEQGES